MTSYHCPSTVSNVAWYVDSGVFTWSVCRDMKAAGMCNGEVKAAGMCNGMQACCGAVWIEVCSPDPSAEK